MGVKKPRRMKHQPGTFRDILEVTRLLSASTLPEQVIETVLNDLRERLGKRARCALLEGDDLRLRFWAGEHTCPVGGLTVHKGSIVWEAVQEGKALNLTDPHQTNGYTHSLDAPIKIKAVIPLSYIDPLTGQPRRVGALIVDSGEEAVPISADDFEYLQVIGQLISAIVGRAELIQQLMRSCRRQEAILMETAHNFRNSIVVIGGFSRRIAKLAREGSLAEESKHLYEEVKMLEAHVAAFEKQMSLTMEENGLNHSPGTSATP